MINLYLENARRPSIPIDATVTTITSWLTPTRDRRDGVTMQHTNTCPKAKVSVSITPWRAAWNTPLITPSLCLSVGYTMVYNEGYIVEFSMPPNTPRYTPWSVISIVFTMMSCHSSWCD